MRAHRSIVAACALAAGAGASADTVVGFHNGAQGWSGPQGPGGSTAIETLGGNPGANMHTVFNDFGITFWNDTNPEFVGDYTQFGSVTLGIDVRVRDISFFGSPVSRPWLVELRDFDDPPNGYPWVSVWYKFADIAEATHGSWTSFSVTIADTGAAGLPPGWGGTGAEDPRTFEPMLPEDRTFASVLAGIDEIAYTTLEPGWFFGFTDFDVRIDNVKIATTAAPAPGEVPLLLLDRAALPGDLLLSWNATCGAADDYGIYEGEVGAWTSHTRIDCDDAAGDRTEQITASAGDRYYLVVPLRGTAEGSYGTDSAGVERPAGLATCRAVHDTSRCF